MLVSTDLHGGIGCFVGEGAGREGEFGEEAEGGKGDGGEGFGHEVFFGGEEDFLDVGVRGLGPEGGEWCHCSLKGVVGLGDLEYGCGFV